MASVSDSLLLDTVQYQLFLSSKSSDLLQCREKYMLYHSKLLIDYIWQHEPFVLNIRDKNANIPAHLGGLTNYGDNVEDEWFIVYLLFELTKAYPDLIVKIFDSDGDFLLIEAADHLPKWLDPTTSENRVFIYRGALHIIPVDKESKNLQKIIAPSIEDALKLIRDNPLATKARDQIQKAIKSRISCFPDAINKNRHLAHCYVPAAIAVLMQSYPNLLPAAVRAFYYRDPLDVKVCRAMKYFPPETCVMTEVNLTRCLYAQLMQQKYKPDKRTGWKMVPENHPLFKSYDSGLKLACGFEILVSKSSNNCSSNDLKLTKQDLSSDFKWNSFIKNLVSNNYFQGELEGSKLYQKLWNQARDFYISNLKCGVEASGESSSLGNFIKNSLSDLDIDMEKLKKNENSLSPPDDDSWLEISPEDLDEMLNCKISNEEDSKELVAGIPKKLSQFVEHVSSIEGVELPKDKKFSGASKFDPESFADTCRNILDLNLPDWKYDSASSSGMSEYEDELDSDDDKYTLDSHTKSSNKSKKAAIPDDMEEYFRQMDHELSKTAMGASFEKNIEDDMSDDNYVPPTDVDLTALKNILESYKSQEGLPGPASNLLGAMGIKLPENADDSSG